MDFPSEFVALRDRLAAAQDERFISRQNAEVAGRTAALLSYFDMSSERKLLGVMALGGVGHAYEYRLMFAAPALSEHALAGWWEYAEAAERELVQPGRNHDFSLVSVILVTDRVEKPVQKALKKLQGGRDFSSSGQGWSSVQMAAVSLEERRVYTNRVGAALKNILKPLL